MITPKPASDEMRAFQKTLEGLSDAQAAAILRELPSRYDSEQAHVFADAVLCGLLWARGCRESVKAFGEIERWYA